MKKNNKIEKISLNKKKITANERILSLDYCRGIAIIFVIAAHVNRGLAKAGILQQLEYYNFIDSFVCAVTIPIFFFLTGGMLKKEKMIDTFGFIFKKMRNILYPYFVWAILLVVFQYVINPKHFNINPIYIILSLPIIPYDIYWFLYVLMMFFIVSPFAIKIDKKIVISFALALFVFDRVKQFYYPLHLFAQYFIFFVIGNYFFKSLLSSIKRFGDKQKFFLSICLISSVLLASVPEANVNSAIIFHDFDRNLSLFALPISVLGIIGFCFLSEWLASKRVLTILTVIGELSLYIYVAHTFFTSVTRRILFDLLEINTLSIHYILGIFIGVIGPISVYNLMKRIDFMKLYKI